MLFNSYEFIFVFLPITLLGCYLIGRRGYQRIAISWLVGASLFFYAWWNPIYLGLILGSILFNYTLGASLGNRKTPQKSASNRGILLFGVAVNLGALGYFKYANFFVDSFNAVAGTRLYSETIVLPLAISFFTFQQIVYLVDVYRYNHGEYNLLNYCLFVTFFPQLIAGPIVHHREMFPQFVRGLFRRFNTENIGVGLTIFSIGLFKKVIIADGVAQYSTPVFNAAAKGTALSFFEAWPAALAYTFQIYFDFSGYSDMAIGLARLFGIRLPLNFHSPYKAVNIIDFWRRWHMTLSRFLRDYVFFAFGGNLRSRARRYLNVMMTMLLGGLWHGANWTFVAWGGLHGLYMLINHGWHALRRPVGEKKVISRWWGRAMARMVTFVAVVVGWVVFRAERFDTATLMLSGMFGSHGFVLPPGYLPYVNRLFSLGDWLVLQGWRFEPMDYFCGINGFLFLTVLSVVCWFMPNTQQFMTNCTPTLDHERKLTHSQYPYWLRWNPTSVHAVIVGVIIFTSLLSLISETPSEFLYFQF